MATTLSTRFGAAVAASGSYLPLALLLSFGSAALAMLLSGMLSPIIDEPVWLVLGWLVLSHAAFVTYLCAYIGAGAIGRGRRPVHAFAAARRGFLPMIVWTALLLPLLVQALPLMVAWWAATCLFAVPARLIEGGWRGWLRLAEPMPVPLWQRIVLLTPSLLFLLALAMLLKDADFGLMDGGMIAMPLAGMLFLWTFYSAALFPAHFAWEVPSAPEEKPLA